MVDLSQEDIERLWNAIVSYVPEKQKLDAAIDFVKCLDDIGVDHEEIKAIVDFDPKLEEAVDTLFEEYDEEDEDYGNRHDEEY